MTNNEIHDTFEKHNDDYLKFEKVENKRSNRPDVHAFILLDQLIPGMGDIISYSGHDEIYLAFAAEDLMRTLTEDIILELVRCGVRHSEESLCMFV